MMLLNKNQTNKKPIQVGILEARRHPAVLYTFCKICKTQDTEVTVFTTSSLFNRLKTWLDDTHQFTFIIKKNEQTLHSFLKHVESYCETQIDLLFVNTIHETWYDLFHFLRFNPDTPKILTIHHLHAWFEPEKHMKHPSFFHKLNIKLMKPRLKKILSYYDAFNVIYPPLKDYALSNLSIEKPVFTLPSSVFEEKNVSEKINKKSRKLTLVLPGLVQKHRKNFTLVLSTLKSLPTSYNKKITLILLGTAFDEDGKKIIRQFVKLTNKGITIHTFHEFIDDELFYSHIEQSDLLFLPIKIHTKSDNGIDEIYGKSVGSGVVYDAIKYAKPVIIPESFTMFSNFQPATLTYTSQKTLAQLLKNCIDHPELISEKQNEAQHHVRHFSLDKLQHYFNDVILTWFYQQKN